MVSPASAPITGAYYRNGCGRSGDGTQRCNSVHTKRTTHAYPQRTQPRSSMCTDRLTPDHASGLPVRSTFWSYGDEWGREGFSGKG